MTTPWLGWLPELRERLAHPPPNRLAGADQRPASVLVPLLVRGGKLWTVLVQRSDRVTHHRRQLAFPGGSLELGEDPWTAALREGVEEIGLPPESVLPLGELDEQTTPTGFRIIPCVGALPSWFEPRVDKSEVEEALTIPLSELRDPRATGLHPIVINGEQRALRLYRTGDRVIWGVTARILENLLSRLG